MPRSGNEGIHRVVGGQQERSSSFASELTCGAVSVYEQRRRNSGHRPLAFVVDHKFEDAVSIRHTEGRRVRSGRPLNGRESGADVGVQHREL